MIGIKENGSWDKAHPDLICPTVLPSLSADLYSEEPGEEEPAWVQTERQQFHDFRDLNKDGRLDGSEVGYWVLPPSQDQPLVEANHLLHESDTDKVSPGKPGLLWELRSERETDERPRKKGRNQEAFRERDGRWRPSGGVLGTP